MAEWNQKLQNFSMRGHLEFLHHFVSHKMTATTIDNWWKKTTARRSKQFSNQDLNLWNDDRPLSTQIVNHDYGN
jgi:hypothetical protein